MGSSLEARWAGIQVAAKATRARMGTEMKTSGSQVLAPVQKAGDEAGEAEGGSCAYEDADDGEGHALADDEVADCGTVGPEGHADAHLLRTLLHAVGHETGRPPTAARTSAHAAKMVSRSMLKSWRAVERTTTSSMVRTWATGKPALAWRSCSVTAEMYWWGSPWVRTSQAMGPMRAMSAAVPSGT